MAHPTSQKCVVNGSISKSKSLALGIPQGTILGPLLFILYINDLPNCPENSEPQMYADDTHLTFAGNNVDIIEQKLNQDLISVSNWLVANKLTLNKSKTEFMVIGSRQRLGAFDRSPALKIDNVLIKQVGSTKSQLQKLELEFFSHVLVKTFIKNTFPMLRLSSTVTMSLFTSLLPRRMSFTSHRHHDNNNTQISVLLLIYHH